MIEIYRGNQGHIMIAILPDERIVVSNDYDNNDIGLLEGERASFANLYAALKKEFEEGLKAL